MNKDLDLVLYGNVLKGKGPWPQGPITLLNRKIREKKHEAVFGKEKCPQKNCPICKPVKIIII